MKNTFGTIGLGLAGAVAAVGLLVGSQVANAQLELSPLGSLTYPNSSGPNNPTVSYDASNTYDIWSFALALEDPGSPNTYNAILTSSGPNIGTFTLTNFAGYEGVSGTLGSGNWLVSSAPSAGNTGDVTLTYNGSDIVATPGSTVNLGVFSFYSKYGPSITGSFTSNVETSNSGSLPGGGNLQMPNSSVVAAPLPLPAAFWPGLLTLGGMAVVGGLRMRRRTA